MTSCDLQGLDDNDEVKQKIERSELVAFLAKCSQPNGAACMLT